MRAAIYARVSKREDQTPENQLLLLRDYCQRQGWEVVAEYVDEASAADLRGRSQWRRLLNHVHMGGLDVVVVVKLDRAFRSAKDTYDTLAELDRHGIRFVATTQLSMDGSPTGRLLLGVLAAVAEFERELIRERTLDGLARAKAQGKTLGRPKGVTDGKPRKKTGYLLRYAGRSYEDD